MQYRTLGRTGIKVTPYALGAMMLGSLGNPDRRQGVRIIHRALDAGINFVDTADRYGDSEEVVGEALKGRRDDVVLATKFWGPVDDDLNHRGASRRWIMQAVERSLRRLQTDHIDLYQLHRPDPDTDIDETLSALTDLVRQGKVRAIGTSSMRGSEIVEAQWMSERRGFERFRTEQPNYSILDREIEREILPVAQRYGMGTLVYSPLAGGTLTGRYRAGQENDNFRSTRTGMRHFRDERRLAAVEELDRALRRGRRAADPPRDGVRRSRTRASPPRSRGRARWSSWRTPSPGSTSRCRTTSSTGSTRSCRPGRASARWTWSTAAPRWATRPCAAGRRRSEWWSDRRKATCRTQLRALAFLNTWLIPISMRCDVMLRHGRLLGCVCHSMATSLMQWWGRCPDAGICLRGIVSLAPGLSSCMAVMVSSVTWICRTRTAVGSRAF